jgi:hypothetical protein
MNVLENDTAVSNKNQFKLVEFQLKYLVQKYGPMTVEYATQQASKKYQDMQTNLRHRLKEKEEAMKAHKELLRYCKLIPIYNELRKLIGQSR